MSNIRLFGVSTDRLMQLRRVAKEHNYAYDFGATFDKTADLLSDTIKQCQSNQIFDFSRFMSMNKIIPVGAPGIGYDILAVVFSAASGIPLVDWDFFVEKPIVELIEAGVIKSKDDFRSESSAGNVGDGSFDKSYKSMQYTAWVQWAEAVAKGNIPHCNAGKIFKYPDIVKFLIEKGFTFIRINVLLSEYIRVLNKHGYIKHHSNWWEAEKQGQIFQFAEKRWAESEVLFNKNKDLIGYEINYKDDPIEMIKDFVISGY